MHLHLDLPQTTLYLDPAIDLHNWRLWPGACYSLTWHCREADGEMYWTDCSSFCWVGVATPWQKGPKENSLTTQCYKQHYIQVLFIYLFFLECWIVNWHAGQRLRSTSGKKISPVNSWKTTKQNELSSAFPRQFWDLKNEPCAVYRPAGL